jgi:hypothetical protein
MNRRKLKSHVRSAMLGCAAICLFAPSMHASPVTFVATGVTANNSTLSGTVTLDPVSGAFLALNLSVSSPFSFSVDILGAFSQGSGETSIVGVSGPNSPQITIDLPTATLAGYAGGSICTGGCTFNSIAATSETNNSLFTSGSLTPVPEPASLALAGGALLGLAIWRGRHAR